MSKKLSICFVCPEAYPVLVKSNLSSAGGSELQQVILAKEFAKKGHRVSFIAGDYDQSEVENIEGITVIRSYKVGYGNRKLRFMHDLVSLIKAMRVAKADIYFQRCVFHHTGKVALFAKLYKKKFIFSAGHDMNASHPKDIEGLPSIYKYSYSWAVKNADIILCQNEKQEQAFLMNYRIKSYVVPNVIEDTMFEPPPNKKKRRIILWVGTFSERKQPLLFAGLATYLKKHEFWMIGIPREQELLDAVRGYANATPNLKVIGFIPQHEIHKYFANADIFVSTSSSEGFPNTFLQAMAHGVPIVSLNVNPDGFLEKSGGGICCYGDFGFLISRVRDLSVNKGKRTCMGKKGLEYVARFHSADAVVQMYERLFTRALNDD